MIEFNEDGGGDEDEFIKESFWKKSYGFPAPGSLTWNITVR